MKTAVVCAALLTIAVMVATAANAQPSMLIPDAVSCARCTISTRTVVRLGSSDGAGALSGPAKVMADGRGRFWVFNYGTPPMVFGTDGRFVQTVGAIGEGPGEFVAADGAFRVPGDSIVVVDGRGRRATVIGPDLQLGRMIRLGANLYPDAIVLRWPDTVIAGGTIPTREARNVPLHTLSFAGPVVEMLRDFGKPDASEPSSGNPAALRRPLSLSKPGLAWAAEAGRYRLTLWTAAGAKVKIIERHPPWFVPSNDLFAGNQTTPPPATVSAIREDPSTGLIWVFVNVAARTWREAWPAGTGREVTTSSIAFDKLWDTRVEVLDPSAGRLVAVGSIPGSVQSMLQNGNVAVYAVDGDGIPRMNVVELRLNGLSSNARKEH